MVARRRRRCHTSLRMSELPTGTVTFLFTDVEGSTRLWEEQPEAMTTSMARHDAILRDAVEARGGYVVKTTGDGVHAVFGAARDALAAAIDGQHALAAHDWDALADLRVRMGVHSGEAEHRSGDYYGSATSRAARLMSVAHGGQILVSLSTEELVSDALPDGVALVDLGEQRLRALSRPERVFQVDAPGLECEFPPLRSIDAYRSNLPVQLTSFVGRDDELVGIAKAFDRARLVTIIGVGGVGKTRLAVQVAAEVVPRFPDGAWLSELAAAGDEEALVQLLAATLGVRPRQGASLDDAIVEYLGDKQAFLVLDNCEHLLDAAASVADRLLRECTGLRILATSREALAIPGEQVWPLRSLGVPPRSGDVVAVAATDAARLFVERAVAARPDFALDATNADAVAEVCRRLDGIPLAIELAAARVSSMRPADVAARLDERFRLLTGGRRTAVERHQTLRATVDWSYSLCSDVERRVFDRLGVFAGSFDAPAAEAVAAGDDLEAWDVLDALTSLVDKSLLVDEETADGSTRFAMLETLRAYARERLDESADPDEWRR